MFPFYIGRTLLGLVDQSPVVRILSKSGFRVCFVNIIHSKDNNYCY